MSTVVDRYAGAARAVTDLVDRLPADAWDRPGLGAWTVRDLVGHTSRALVTVIEYLRRPVDEEVLTSSAAYVAGTAGGGVDPVAVTERGRQAGRDLGTDPAGRFRALADDAVRVAEATDVDLVVHTIGGGMRVAAYLPTRTFELCVHGLDITVATGLEIALPADALEEAASIAAAAAVRRGHGPDLLLGLTGRQDLPHGFSVV